MAIKTISRWFHTLDCGGGDVLTVEGRTDGTGSVHVSLCNSGSDQHSDPGGTTKIDVPVGEWDQFLTLLRSSTPQAT